jgi:hypothetical protein
MGFALSSSSLLKCPDFFLLDPFDCAVDIVPDVDDYRLITLQNTKK